MLNKCYLTNQLLIKCNDTKTEIKRTYIEASVVVPDFDARYSKVWGALRVPDNEVELDGRVERTHPHVTLFGGLSTQEKRRNQQILCPLQ